MTVGDVIDFVYSSLIERSEVPSLDQVATAFGEDRSSMARFIRDAKIGKTLLLDGSDDIWMAGPFSASRALAFRVAMRARRSGFSRDGASPRTSVVLRSARTLASADTGGRTEHSFLGWARWRILESPDLIARLFQENS